METGKALLDIETLSPHDMVRDALELFQADARDKGITLDYAVADDLPSVLGDAKRLQHVLSNLVSNALRFTKPGGSVTVSADAGEETVKFTVADTGVGIAPDNHPGCLNHFSGCRARKSPRGSG